jgi:AraC-like DNA-binding protein
MKAKDLPPNSGVIEHKHDWDQLIYAVSGLLEVSSSKGQHLIPSGQGIWIPANQYHSIATHNGAKLRSVHVEKGQIEQFGQAITVLKVDDLVRLLITKASQFPFSEQGAEQETEHGNEQQAKQAAELTNTAVKYANESAGLSAAQLRLLAVLVDQIAQLEKAQLYLPLSDDILLSPILSWQQAHLDQHKSLQQWSAELGASSKTIARRFESKLGLSFSGWREQLKLHKAIAWLSDQRSVTDIALSLGYESLPAFIQMFKRHTGTTPGKFNKS